MRYIESTGHACEHVRAERLGRYEYVQGSSAKFYHVMMDMDGKYWAFFGRLDAKSPQKRSFSDARQAEQVIQEKRNKGYQWCEGYSTGVRQMMEERAARLDQAWAPAAEPLPSVRRPRL